MRSVVLVLALALLAASCSRLGLGDGPPVTVPNVSRERSVDPARALALINEHRASRGREALALDPSLNAVAVDTARELARRDKLKTEMHTKRGLARRLDGSGYDFSHAAENLGAGYPTLDSAMAGWKGSRSHNKNLLKRNVTHAGIGLALTDKGKFKSYWVLILAKPAAAPDPS